MLHILHISKKNNEIDSSSIPPDQNAPNHILQLNDDCLQHIFERIVLSHLGHITKVCV